MKGTRHFEVNLQIEHHLFTSIDSKFLPNISNDLIKLCDKYDVKYNNLKNLLNARISHYKYVKELGKN